MNASALFRSGVDRIAFLPQAAAALASTDMCTCHRQPVELDFGVPACTSATNQPTMVMCGVTLRRGLTLLCTPASAPLPPPGRPAVLLHLHAAGAVLGGDLLPGPQPTHRLPSPRLCGHEPGGVCHPGKYTARPLRGPHSSIHWPCRRCTYGCTLWLRLCCVERLQGQIETGISARFRRTHARCAALCLCNVQAGLWVFCSVSSSEGDTQLGKELSGCFLAFVSAAAAFAFLLYGGRLWLMLRRFPIESRGRRKKLREVGLVTTICATCFLFR